MALKLLLFGDHSFIGSHLSAYLRDKGFSVVSTNREASSTSLFFDIQNQSLEDLNLDLSEFSHALICIAIPNIVKCQTDKSLSFQINVLNTLQLVLTLVEKRIKPILFSSDVVFDGCANSYDELSNKKPLNEYGKQKSILEDALQSLCEDDYLLLRLSKTYSTEVPDKTFIFELAQRLNSNLPIQAATDLLFNPIDIYDVCQAVELLIRYNKTGLYNICSEETTSWYKVAFELSDQMGKSGLITQISIDEINSSTPRAKNLNVRPTRLKKEFPNFKFRSLSEGIERVAHYTCSPQPLGKNL